MYCYTNPLFYFTLRLHSAHFTPEKIMKATTIPHILFLPFTRSGLGLFIYLCLICTATAQTVQSPIRMKYITSDYSGVCSNGKSVLCYGTNGIITRSTDKGETWHRSELNVGFTITAMDTLNGDYYAVSDSAILHSNNNGMTWRRYPLDGGFGITHHNDTLYILSSKGLLMCTPSTLNSPVSLYSLDSMGSRSDIIISNDGNLIQWIEESRFVATYRLSNATYNTINVVSLFPCPTCVELRHLQRKGGILYAAVADVRQRLDNRTRSLREVYYEIVRSSDNGKTWTRFSPDINTKMKTQNMMNVTVLNDSQAVALMCSQASPPSILQKSGFQLLTYVVINASGRIDLLNPTDTMPRQYAWFSNEQRIRQVLRIDDRTLIAVGNHHCILRTTTNGASWDYQSYCPTDFYSRVHKFSSPDPSTLYVASEYGEILGTRNGGVTFMPRNLQLFYQLASANVVFAHFDSKGRGCVIYDTKKEKDTNVFVTNDFGMTYTPLYNLEYYHSYDSLSYMAFDDKKLVNSNIYQTIATENTFFLYGTATRLDTGNFIPRQVEPFSIVLRLRKKDFSFIDTTRLPVNRILTMITVGNSVYLIGKNGTSPQKMSANEVEFPTYCMYRSTDEGETWDSVRIHLPVTVGVGYSRSRYSAIGNEFEPRFQMGNKLVFYLNSKAILRYDMQTNTCDTINPNVKYKGGYARENTMIMYQNKVVGLTWSNNLAVTSDMTANWDTVSINQAIDWKDDGSEIMGFVTNSTDIGFVLIDAPGQKIQLARYVPNTTPVSVEFNTGDTYIWSTSPFPLPTNGIITTILSWDIQYGVGDVQTTVTDILGTPVEGLNLNLDQMDKNVARLRVNMTGQAVGVYLITVRVGSGARIIPILVR